MPLSISRWRIVLSGSLAIASVTAFAAEDAASASSAAPRKFAVIELPSAAAPGLGRQRAHHALSIATDAPKPFLRSLGIDATECTVRFRLPSRITPSRESTTGMRLDVQAQAGLGCRF